MDNKYLSKIFAKRLRELREAHRLSQQELSDRTELYGRVSQQAVSNYESGEGNPSMNHILSLSRAFGMSIHEFFPGEDEWVQGEEKAEAV